MTQDHTRQENLERMRDAVEEQAKEARARAEEESRLASDRPPDELSPRQKSTGHKKKTADKWNQ